MRLIINVDINEEDVSVTSKLIEDENVIHRGYAVTFDEKAYMWDMNSQYNLAFLRQQQIYCNDLLRSHGYLFVNEVLNMLGLPRTAAGQILGWVYKKDSVVDFGLSDNRNLEFIDGISNIALLNFNIDGEIIDKI